MVGVVSHFGKCRKNQSLWEMDTQLICNPTLTLLFLATHVEQSDAVTLSVSVLTTGSPLIPHWWFLIAQIYLFKSPLPMYSITINTGCLMVQQANKLIIFSWYPILFIVLISLKKSSASSSVGLVFSLLTATITEFPWPSTVCAINTRPNAPLPISGPKERLDGDIS